MEERREEREEGTWAISRSESLGHRSVSWRHHRRGRLEWWCLEVRPGWDDIVGSDKAKPEGGLPSAALGFQHPLKLDSPWERALMAEELRLALWRGVMNTGAGLGKSRPLRVKITQISG
jgi:hypothetical protein